MTADGRIITSRYPEHRVSVFARQTASIERKRVIHTEMYAGEVFCAEVPTHHTLVTRRKGKILVSGNCVFNAWSRALAYAEANLGHGVEVMSRLAPYWHYRDGIGAIGEDTGATIRDGIKTIHRFGVPLEMYWPYDETRWQEKPSPTAEAEGEHRRVGLLYLRLESQGDIIDNLARGFPAVFGTMLYRGFWSVTATSPVVPMPGVNDAPEGGHAMCIVGCDTRARVYRVANSWGPDWGRNGYCLMPFDYIEECASDFWSCRKIAA